MPTQPLVSIDAVPLIVQDGQLCVITGLRLFEPFIGQAALPGVLLNANERLSEAVERALLSKTGISEYLAMVHTAVFDDFERDERGPTLSIAHLVLLDRLPDSDSVRVYPLDQLPALPFDHNQIISQACSVLLDSLWVNTDLTKALLGDDFTTADVVARMKELATAAGRPEPVVNNVGRALSSNKAIRKLEAVPQGTGRPPARWQWVEQR
ncbi:hypothetical protein [Glutamicibacter sp.]|uniref:hypothetical protein n=1 Tax=Glutamicibacter sp. TaxID=1931995 RepID=UPI0028BE3C8A|nr:hypothetical protein [Glutamicibacter sp.]